MKIFIKIGKRYTLPFLYKDVSSDSLWCFQFYGDTDYIDPFNSSSWTIDTDNEIKEIIGVGIGNFTLLPTLSKSDCEVIESSFFWDDTNGILYVHYLDNNNDWAINHDFGTYSSLESGYSNGFHKLSQNVFDGFFYRPIMANISGFSDVVDPIKFGIISYRDSSFDLVDEGGEFINFPGEDSIGAPAWIYYIPENVTTLSDTYRIFTGFLNGYRHGRSAITYNVKESRVLENKPTSPNKMTKDEFPLIGDLEQSLKPFSFGDIRRGIMVLTNIGELTTASSGTAKFLISDPEISKPFTPNYIYDENNNAISVVSYDSSTCIVSVTKPAGVDPNTLKDWTWDGNGPNLTPGLYNGPAPIIRECFLKLANIPYLATTYDTASFASFDTNNPFGTGISVQSERGFFDEIIQPITLSYQFVLKFNGTGQIQFIERNPYGSVKLTSEKYNQLGEPTITVDSENMVSDLVIEYSPNFRTGTPLLYNYNDESSYVFSKYGIKRNDPISPVKTVLTFTSSPPFKFPEELAEKIMSTSKDAERIISWSKNGISELELFDIVKIDTGEYNTVQYEYGEVLEKNPDYNNDQESIKIRIIPDYIEGD